MALFEFYPSLPLRAYVRVYRIVNFVFQDASAIPFKPYPPRPEQCLSFYPRDTETVAYANSGQQITNLKIALIGQQCEVTNRYVGQHFLVFQVVFQPGALYRLTGIPSYELTNAYLDAEAVFSGTIREVNEKLNEAADFGAMVKVVESFLLTQLNYHNRDAHRLDEVSGLILSAAEIPKIDALARASYLSVKQFERKFVERMGVSPKYYCKVVRFENAYRMKNKYPHLSWFAIAIRCGYYDYQHLVKDYQSLTGCTPNVFHLADLSAPERKFGVADVY